MMKTPDQALQVSRPAIDNLTSEAFDTREATYKYVWYKLLPKLQWDIAGVSPEVVTLTDYRDGTVAPEETYGDPESIAEKVFDLVKATGGVKRRIEIALSGQTCVVIELQFSPDTQHPDLIFGIQQ